MEGTNQTQGDQELSFNQTQGTVNIDTGEQNQNVNAGNQSQEVSYGTQTASGPTASATYGDQTLGDQNVEGHRNTSPLNNNQTIDTDVSGVNVYVTTTTNCGCSNKEHKKEKQSGGDSCCQDSLCQLLREIASVQSLESSVGIEIYPGFQTSSSLSNQLIINIDSFCQGATFVDAAEPTSSERTTISLGNISGIMVDDSNESVFQLIQQFAVSCNLPTHNNNCTCGREKSDCQKSSLASDLASAGRFGIPVSLFVEGQVEPLDPLSVLNVCDCLVILTDDVSNPSFFYVFTTCSINGFVTE